MRNIILLFLMIFSISCNSQPLEDPVPVYQEIKLFSKILNEERVINIWIPEGYENAELPVLYMPDGGIKEDFPHIANTLEKLIKEEKIKPILLVGIQNTERRRDLTGVTNVASDKKIAKVVGGSSKFRNFIQSELFPQINNKYKTTNYKGIIGESLAGYFIVETFFDAPQLFDVYIAMDPSIWWNNHSIVRNAASSLDTSHQNKILWFAGSNAKDINKYTNQLKDIFQKKSLEGLKWKYEDEPNEEHTTIYRATKEKALIWALNQ